MKDVADYLSNEAIYLEPVDQTTAWNSDQILQNYSRHTVL